jgi:chorismate--pyruvate lyase
MSMDASKLLFFLSRTAKWRNANVLSATQFDQQIWQWLKDDESLTQRLIDVSNGRFSIDLLQQEVTIPIWHEQDCLGQSHHLAATVREVSLNVIDQPIVLARSVIPLSLIRKHQNGLTNLGRQPLGQLLFKEGKVRISRRQFTQINLGQDIVYGRRTPYEYMGSIILVCEFYLPRISEFSLV